MRICLIQNKANPGLLSPNIKDHKRFIDTVSAQEPDLIVFSELSLTGYEPSLAKELALLPDSKELDIFQDLSDRHQTRIAVGLPIQCGSGVQIGLALFQPGLQRIFGAKNHLHSDEDPFFVKGANLPILEVQGKRIAFAICYELSVSQHAQAASDASADIYLASVAKTSEGVKSAYERLSHIAQSLSLTTLMVNAIGPADNFHCAGQSAAWNSHGQLLGSLGSDRSGALILNTETGEAQRLPLEKDISAE
ncbi:MAG: carbon-nitrogen hydrolase family protein [Planctomycetota bacterium]|nr:carbon-nitrogen hydrolase family protein [Planctomycetota bacterium]